jgi:hypothetical protein
MAGEASAHDARAAAVGAHIEADAMATWPSYDLPDGLDDDHTARPTLLGRLKAALAA